MQGSSEKYAMIIFFLKLLGFIKLENRVGLCFIFLNKLYFILAILDNYSLFWIRWEYTH